MTAGHPASGDRTAYWLNRLASGGVFLALVVAVLAASILSPAFYQPSNLLNIFRQAAALGILSIAQTMVIIAGGVDLSVAATMQLAVVLMAEISRGDDRRVLAAAIVCLIFGALIGWINGVIVTKRKVPAFVVTLGVGVVVTGARLAFTMGSPSGLLPPVVRLLGGGYVAGVPVILVIFAALALVSQVLLTKTTFGRRLYARGANVETARLSGVYVDRILILTYVITGVVSVLAGLVLAGYLGYADQWIGKGYEFDSIAAVVVGGGSFSGGVGTVGGTVAGVLLVTILVNVVLLLNLNVQYQLIVKGIVIIAAVALYSLRRPSA
jgi:ribose/xylose/arabinose/galactoside ABC-type transport system permease subunit